MFDPADYSIVVRKGVFDGEQCFEARVLELPDVAEYADTYEEAYELALDTIQITAEIFSEKGKIMPSPLIPAGDYSGRVTLRVPKSLHRTLVDIAEIEGVSLNQHIVNVLGYFSGYASRVKTVLPEKSYRTCPAVAEVHYKKPELKVIMTRELRQANG